MPRTIRNHGEVLFGTVKLENKEYRAIELVPLVGRNKRRVQSLCEKLNLGQKLDPLHRGDPTRILTKRDVEQLLKWFDAHGRKHWEAPWTEKLRKPRRKTNSTSA